MGRMEKSSKFNVTLHLWWEKAESQNLIIDKKTKYIFYFENINPKSLSVHQAVVIHTHYPGGLCQSYKGPPRSFLPTTIVWRMTEGSWLEVVQVSPLQTPSDHQQPSRKTNWNAALTSTVPKNVKRECPKCGNFTYHIFLKNSRPVTNREVTGCARSWVCVCWGEVRNVLSHRVILGV